MPVSRVKEGKGDIWEWPESESTFPLHSNDVCGFTVTIYLNLYQGFFLVF